MANRVLLGDIGSGNYGLKISKPGFDVTTTADKNLLFNSEKGRTGQIYAGAAGLNFVDSTSDQEAEIRGTTNAYQSWNVGTPVNHSGKKIIIDGTTVTLATTTTYFGSTYTTVANMVTDINNANISNVTAYTSTLSSLDHRLKLRKTGSDMVISYPSSNSLENVVGIPPGTVDYPDLASNGVNYLTASGNTKPSLGYVPLIMLTETVNGVKETADEYGDLEVFEIISRVNLWETTASHMYPARAEADLQSIQMSSGGGEAQEVNQGTEIGNPTSKGREYFDDAIDSKMSNAQFFVLRVPCAYGYMTSSYF